MNFTQLDKAIQLLVSDVRQNFSIAIDTPDGHIRIDAAKKRKAASLAKIPILIEAIRLAEENKLSLEKLIFIEKAAMVGGSGVINYLTDSNIHSYQNLLELMIIVSDNTASNLLLDTVGMDNINKLAQILNCRETNMERKFMDQQAQQEGHENYTSAQDMITFLKLISENNDFLSGESRKQMLRILLNQQFKNKLAKNLKDKDQIKIYHKSGELHGVEHEAAIYNYKNKKMEVAILSEGWTRNGIGQEYIAEIGKLLINYFSK
ncbi:hypothetical protein CIL03_05765 [Virgibacillus indicus]|uniref:Beta-lactamase class A catalytic domain-containing protein n=1 Tax=Virgibacillus indicus TaxID=2024554 RepID=A0A265NBQ8_9BACI|nr:serine hydrolase [Virgibacillus indicus]OZU89225.1 hypothetical protein CIL03_05765 [Virgibacillus indicus]